MQIRNEEKEICVEWTDLSVRNGLSYFKYYICIYIYYICENSLFLKYCKYIGEAENCRCICQTSLYELLCDITENTQSNYVTTLPRQ